MKFIDQTKIIVKSGDGGSGMVSFKTARNRPKLGADGGDGGFGGDVYLLGNSQLNTLEALRYKKVYRALHGDKGGTNNKTGKNGEHCYIKVPLGTVVKDSLSGEVICEILTSNEPVLIAKGGKRGLGNLRYLSSIHQAPEESTPGGKGEEKEISLELKLMADVGLAGFPNAGKSTLLGALSNAKPLIADYPFTTLTPQLGMVDISDITDVYGDAIVMADIPGLIEGASEGKGLGHEFLKHLERTRIILYLLDGFLEPEEIFDAFIKLQKELKAFSQELSRKVFAVVVNKIDLISDEEIVDKQNSINEIFLAHDKDIKILYISGAQRKRLKELRVFLAGHVKNTQKE